MNIIYKRVFNTVIGHDYYKDGYDPTVTLIPTAETRVLLRNGKMLFKKPPNGITVLYRALDDESTPFVQLNNDQRFTFVIKTGNIPGLLNITNFDESPAHKYSTGSILYFTNNPANTSSNKNNPEILSYEIIDTLRSRLFTYQFALNGNPATVKIVITNAAGNPVSAGKDTNGNPLPTTLTLSLKADNTYEQQINLGTNPKGRYLISILNDAKTDTLKEERIYVDELLEKQNIPGIVDIVYETATNHLYGDTEEYKLQFKRADTTWKYFIINKSNNIDLSTDSLLIADTGLANGSPYDINNFPRAYAGIRLNAKSTGSSGNSIGLQYIGTGDFTALIFSGETLAGGIDSIAAKGTITIINNEITGYTVSIDGNDFTEGVDFAVGTTPADTATSLIAAINANGSVLVTASALAYDILINNLETLVFQSDQPIPFFEKPKLNIELQQASSNQQIIANLPNPSHGGIKKAVADRIKSEVYVFI